jgi:hypothetical protein
MPELIPQAVTRRLGLALTGYRASDTVAWGNRGGALPSCPITHGDAPQLVDRSAWARLAPEGRLGSQLP